VTNIDAAFGQACANGGKLFMAGCSPTYWGCAQPTSGRPFFETEGGEGILTEWNWIIQNQPDWVEIVTWNDLNESTYLNPLAAPDQFNQSPPKRYSHAGYLELAKRYISWYKTGQQPPITRDSLYYFYRTHSTNAVAMDTNDVPVTVFLGSVEDAINTTVLLTAPASLEIISGATRTTNSLPSGISNLRTPFASGAQIFTLRRNQQQLLTIQGPNVLTKITNYDYFTASGYSYVQTNLPPPSDLHVIIGQ
jgi:glucan endo-1,3-alpha-glucosidase